ncbi:hypothetical protein ED28_12565 [[Pantoea] beijingensis]|uniref:CinA C-terminal domain-containing protein n=1 Tax=[Pantoea] beijingensis TaxID=1324864 RepID=A0A443IC04_9GAMM|nr:MULTISPECIES: nicotinamide-nucleotide amidase [Erwiniaceae]RWR01629.1 hypothetical protein ED28_12565 [[Pantoea] beijingensis]
MADDELKQLSISVGKCLQQRNATITVAESCTGGWVAKALTDIAGSSAWFEYGFVTYSNSAKQKLLGVGEPSLARWGAVSEVVVHEMAVGALRVANAQFAISVSGIAGPEGGTAEKPVGSVWFGFACADGRFLTCLQHFTGDRDAIRHQAAVYALHTLLNDFLENKLDTV